MHHKAIDLTGQRFGHLVVVEEAGKNKYSSKKWKCQCDCGKLSTPYGCALRSGRATTCGCRTGKEFNPKEYKVAYCKANRKQITLKHAEYYKTHAARISAYRKAYSKDNALYDTHILSISWAEEGRTRRDPGKKDDLQVKCSLCQSWFNPTNSQVSARSNSINGSRRGEGSFYCSDDCKRACPVYNQTKFRKGDAPKPDSRPGQREWREHVIACSEFSCEKCGKVLEEKDLSAHHIKSVSQYPLESMDIDNGMALCKDCHKAVHSGIGCRPVDLRCSA